MSNLVACALYIVKDSWEHGIKLSKVFKSRDFTFLVTFAWLWSVAFAEDNAYGRWDSPWLPSVAGSVRCGSCVHQAEQTAKETEQAGLRQHSALSNRHAPNIFEKKTSLTLSEISGTTSDGQTTLCLRKHGRFDRSFWAVFSSTHFI